MKIQINSLEVLERLIGGDNKLEVEIRNNIVQNFTKKHLKSIAEDMCKSLHESILLEINKQVESSLSDCIDACSYYNKRFVPKISSKFKSELERNAGALAYHTANEKITEVMESPYVENQLKKLCDHEIYKRFDKMVANFPIDEHPQLKQTVEGLIKRYISKKLTDGL